ncbi:MAG: carbohydrate porin [Chthoniobacterales bacterium]
MNRRSSLLLFFVLCVLSNPLMADADFTLQSVNPLKPAPLQEPLHLGVGVRLQTLRSVAETNGVTFNVESASDILGNPTGGMSTGATYSGLLVMSALVDLQKAMGWEGASIKTTWLWLYGNNLSAQYLGNSLAASSIAGVPAFRCYEMWFQQNFLGNAFSLRAGLLGLDTEFIISDTATFFVNAAFGIAPLFAMNIPNGGPQCPMATPGVRLALQPLPWLTLRSAISQANPFQQQANQYNFNWNFGPAGGLLSLNELQAAWNKAPSDRALPGTAKAGFWIESGAAAQESSLDQFAFAPPNASAYNSGFYGIIDQELYRPSDKISPGTVADSKASANRDRNYVQTQGVSPNASFVQGLSSFFRVGFSPQADAPVSLYSDAGLVYTGLIPTRYKDRLGLAFGYAKVGPQQVQNASETGYRATFEAVGEVSYAFRFHSVSIQPDLQYIIHPGGTRQYANALVVGVRVVVVF